ncbi:hypothetical protein [Luteimonas sp. FCS-9]|uniref:hypothetical protein n=1 Tax=Luteimonas sp. FCS-9 TaxID=1547516 RepID=UPI000A72626E|nr:hypothetical protein [Luteimonas sp. FCS-9]
MKMSARWIPIAFIVICLGLTGSALAAPATPCTAENESATEFVPNRNGGAIYQCINGRWERIAVCGNNGQCIYL